MKLLFGADSSLKKHNLPKIIIRVEKFSGIILNFSFMVETDAEVTLDKSGYGFAITEIVLKMNGKVPGITK